MSKSTPEQKLADQMSDNLSNHWFNPALFANLMVNGNNLYTLDRLMDMIKWIIKYEQIKFLDEWEHGNTSEGLLLASHLAEVIDAKENPEKHMAKE
jgi:hypothetical protein